MRCDVIAYHVSWFLLFSTYDKKLDPYTKMLNWWLVFKINNSKLLQSLSASTSLLVTVELCDGVVKFPFWQAMQEAISASILVTLWFTTVLSRAISASLHKLIFNHSVSLIRYRWSEIPPALSLPMQSMLVDFGRHFDFVLHGDLIALNLEVWGYTISLSDP